MPNWGGRVPDDAATRVARGAALLDRKAPGWEPYMQLATLNVASYADCPLGQRYGVYSAGMRVLFGWRYALEDYLEALSGFGFNVEWIPNAAARDHGFLSEGHTYRGGYAELTSAWRDLIAARRAAAYRDALALQPETVEV